MTTLEASILRCPNCGADVAEGARSCGYCHAELATVRCHHCFALSRTKAVHCSGCGRELGLEPVGGEDTRHCPSCRLPLVAFRGTGGLLLDCTGCGGQFVEHGLLTSLLEEREVAGLAVPRRVQRAQAELEPVRYLPCPGCGALMNRKNFGGESGVIVDVCHTHGTWFDEGELPRVLAFVESGGLALARAHQRERDGEEARARRLAQKPVELGELSTLSSSDGAAFGMPALASAAAELVSWLYHRRDR